MSRFPFTAGHTFDLILRAGSDSLLMEIDGASFCTFIYRPIIKPREANSITVIGDLTIHKFDFLESTTS
jgi:hypothetical protein